jgi:hypothetical protein
MPILNKLKTSVKLNSILTEEIDQSGRVMSFSSTRFAIGKKLEAESVKKVWDVAQDDIKRHLKNYRGSALVTITTSKGTFKKWVNN